MTKSIHRPLCKLLEEPENTRLKIVLPRGWLKTTVCTIAYPLWRAVRDPNVRVLLAQNTYTNASKKLSAIRAVVESNGLFRSLWPDILPRADTRPWNEQALQLTRPKAFPEATFEVAGIRTQITGRHYDLVIEDDTVAPDLDEMGEQNISPTKDDIDQAIGWHRLVTPILNDIATSQNVVVGTRWFEKDLLSWIEDNEPYFKSYTRAVREDENGRSSESGTIVYPERFGERALEEIAARMGPYLFRCLYLNSPTRSEDMIFRPEWFRFFDEVPQKELATYTTVDPAGDPETAIGKDPDYNVVLTTAKHLDTGQIYVLDYFRKRCNPGELIDAIFQHVNLYSPLKVGIESIAYQRSLNYWVRERQRATGVFFMIEELRHGRSKGIRIRGLQPLVSEGALVFRRSQVELMNELLAFPLGAHDDLADALAMHLPLWQVTRTRRQERDRIFGRDPFLFESVISELRGRFRKPGVFGELESRNDGDWEAGRTDWFDRRLTASS